MRGPPFWPAAGGLRRQSLPTAAMGVELVDRSRRFSSFQEREVGCVVAMHLASGHNGGPGLEPRRVRVFEALSECGVARVEGGQDLKNLAGCTENIDAPVGRDHDFTYRSLVFDSRL